MASYAAELRRRLAAETSHSTQQSRSGGRVDELAGLFDAAGACTESGLSIDASSAAVARSAVRLLRSEFGVEPQLSGHGSSPGSFGRARYVVRASRNRALQAVEELRAARAGIDAGPRGGRANAYLRGAFQGAGSVTPPGYRKGHHLEFVHRNERFARRVATLCRVCLLYTSDAADE